MVSLLFGNLVICAYVNQRLFVWREKEGSRPAWGSDNEMGQFVNWWNWYTCPTKKVDKMCTPFQLSCRNNQQHVGIVAFTFVYNTHTHTQIEDQLGQATRTSCRTGSLISLLNADCAILCILFTCYTNKGCFWLLTVQKCEILCLTSFAGIMKWQSCEANCSMLLCMLLICMVMTVRIC